MTVLRAASTLAASALLGAGLALGPTAWAGPAAGAGTTSWAVPTGVDASPAGADAIPTDGQTQGVLAVPAEVGEWYASQAPANIRAAAAAGELDVEVAPEGAGSLSVGTPRAVTAWSPQLLEGRQSEQVVVRTDDYVAPILLDGTGVGVLGVTMTGDRVGDGRLVDAPGLADSLAALDTVTAVVRDDLNQAWFGYSFGTVAPLDDAAQELLAGTAELSDLLPFLVDDTAPEASMERPSIAPVAAVGVVVLAVLALAGTLTWLRWPEREEPGDRTRAGGERVHLPRRLRRGATSWDHKD